MQQDRFDMPSALYEPPPVVAKPYRRVSFGAECLVWLVLLAVAGLALCAVLLAVSDVVSP